MNNCQQLSLKTKLSKQTEQDQNHTYGEYLEGSQLGGGRKRMGEKVQGLSTSWQVQNIQGGGGVKNSIGNGVAKELICMTRGHELREESAGGNGATGQRGAKGEILGLL